MTQKMRPLKNAIDTQLWLRGIICLCRSTVVARFVCSVVVLVTHDLTTGKFWPRHSAIPPVSRSTLVKPFFRSIVPTDPECWPILQVMMSGLFFMFI